MTALLEAAGDPSIVGFDAAGTHLFADGLDLSRTTSLRRAWLEPSGTTPLLSAIDDTLDLIGASEQARAERSQRREDHLLLAVTDGADYVIGPLGRDQMRALHLYNGTDHPHAGQQPEVLDVASMNRKNKAAA